MSEEWVKLHEIAIQWDPYDTSPNRLRSLGYRQQWAIGQAKDGSRRAALAAWSHYGDRCFIVPVRLSITIYRKGRRLDDGNAISGMKWAEDQLFSALDYPGRGFTPTDGPTWLTHGPVAQVVGRDYEAALRQGRVKGPTVVLTIEGNPAAKRPKLRKEQRERLAAGLWA